MKTLKEIIHFPDILLIDENSLDEMVNKKVSQPTHNSHLDHIEDLFIRHGHEGMTRTVDVLTKMNDFLNGKKHSNYHVRTKYDGIGIVWGTHPDTKQFFVGTKSFFNKTPKVNYTAKDIKVNHGSTPGLSAKLKHALEHLPKITPKTGVFQGDLMFTPGDVVAGEKDLSFSPNTLTYNVDKESAEGKRLSAAKIGIAPHTYYVKGQDDLLHAKYDLNLHQFARHPDVHIFDPTVKLKNTLQEASYSGTHQKHFASALAKAQEHYKKYLQTGGAENIADHKDLLVGYINRTVKEKRDPSSAGYTSFLNSQFKKRIEGLKMDKSKQNLKKQLAAEIQNITQRKATFDSLFQTHKHIQTAKTHLVNALSKNSPYRETILGNKSKPEGFVVSYNDKPVKLVDRHHFSAANFAWNDKANPADNPTVLTFGRMNPPTAGHQRLLDKAADVARRQGAKNVNVVTRTQDPTNNPLKPDDKLKWLGKMFPNHKIMLSHPDAAGIIGQLKDLHSKGVKHLTIVAGHDRIDDYQKMMARYNGEGKNKFFNFPHLKFVSSGPRVVDSDGVEGISGSKMRKFARVNDFKSFRRGLPGHVPETHARKLFRDLRGKLSK